MRFLIKNKKIKFGSFLFIFANVFTAAILCTIAIITNETVTNFINDKMDQINESKCNNLASNIEKNTNEVINIAKCLQNNRKLIINVNSYRDNNIKTYNKQQNMAYIQQCLLNMGIIMKVSGI